MDKNVTKQRCAAVLFCYRENAEGVFKVTLTKLERKVYFMAVLKITSENFDEVKNSDKPVLIDFYADWCGPCKMVSPIVDQIAEENPNIIVGKVNVDDEEDLAASFGVMSIPMLVVLKNGEVANKSVGVQPKEKILEMVK